jgi:hypothetical protein
MYLFDFVGRNQFNDNSQLEAILHHKFVMSKQCFILVSIIKSCHFQNCLCALCGYSVIVCIYIVINLNDFKDVLILIYSFQYILNSPFLQLMMMSC